MGNIKTTADEKARDKRKQRNYLPKSRSVRSVSGGLPTLGKRR
jgi:hypothetical protein